jgi:hypothetical protein
MMTTDRIMASAVLYLLLGVGFGPSRALHLVMDLALVVAWFQVSKGLSLVAIGFGGFLRGLLAR